MLSGEVYEASHTKFLERLVRTKSILREFNALPADDLSGQRRLLRTLLGKTGGRFHFNQPFRCDYGCNISIGENFFANFELTILDEAMVTIGDNVFIGPNVSIYTACHPVDPEQRRLGVQWAEPVTIGNDVWIGGGTIILPGVTVGDGTTIAPVGGEPQHPSAFAGRGQSVPGGKDCVIQFLRCDCTAADM